MTALFLYKHVKIANTTLLLGRCPLYISYTHVKIVSISKCPLYQSLRFSYAISPKLWTLHFYYTFLMKVHPKSSKLHFPYVLPFPFKSSAKDLPLQIFHFQFVDEPDQCFRQRGLAHLIWCMSISSILTLSTFAGPNIIASSTDSDLEVFSHNPADDSFAPLPDRTGTNTKYLNGQFLLY
jgi:hypothetical protein